jgi:hypothetical protein
MDKLANELSDSDRLDKTFILVYIDKTSAGFSVTHNY